MRLATFIVGYLFIWSSTVSAQERLPTRTLNELVSRSTAVVIGTPRQFDIEGSQVGMVNVPFAVERLIKDDRSVGLGAVVPAKCRLRDLKGDRFLLLRSKDRKGALRWQVKQALSREAVQHLVALSKADLRDVGRLEYFFDYLEHPDPVIAANAELEFMLTSDETFALFAARLEAAELRKRLAKKDIPSHRCRLYLAILTKCGNATDGDWIKAQLVSSDGKATPLGAYLMAYIALKGEDGLAFLDESYLAGANIDFTLTYSAILALRYAVDHPEVGISVDRLLQSFRLALDQPLLFDIIVNNLAGLSDWSSMDRIVELGRALEDPTFHMATINYLRRCPGDKAKQNLNEWAQRYPKVYQRAMSFYPDSALKKKSERKSVSIRLTERPGHC